jgi:hypothetical protein
MGPAECPEGDLNFRFTVHIDRHPSPSRPAFRSLSTSTMLPQDSEKHPDTSAAVSHEVSRPSARHLPSSGSRHIADRRNVLVQPRLDDLSVREPSTTQTLNFWYIGHGSYRNPRFKCLVDAQASRERASRVHDVHGRLGRKPYVLDLDFTCWRKVRRLQKEVLGRARQEDRSMY